MEDQSLPSTETPVSPEPGQLQLPAGPAAKKPNRTWAVVLGVLVVVALFGLTIYQLVRPETDTGKIRDIFIIFLAVESLVTGIVLIVLVVQIALLINLLQNEIKPILESTNETVNTLKGTTTFLSNNLTAPVIKMNEYLAGLKKLLDLLFPGKR
jgi:nitrate reductase gamma subunit